MEKLSRKWKIFVIHHTHTDIGYTDSQEIITDRQIDFLKQAVEICEKTLGFKWVCETFWAVEQFLREAEEEIRLRFENAVIRGDIEMTGNYLNLNEAIDEDTLRYFTDRAKAYAAEIKTDLTTAMTADINGYSWGYSQVLFDAGIRNLMSNTHNHHGMFPLFQKQMPFYWETPGGDKLLVWNGDHYQLGNEMGIVPGAAHSYVIQDEFTAWSNMDSELSFALAEVRIGRYLAQLEKEGYPFDFVPLNVTGLITDNAPPNGKIMEFIERWNQKYAGSEGSEISVTIEMTTLGNFFERVRNSGVEIKTYRGDWPDWWSDGLGSSLNFTKTLRQAQRTLRTVRESGIIGKEELGQIYYDIMLGAEHTFSYSSAMEEPWGEEAALISSQKLQYAVEANQLANMALNRVKRAKGEVILRAERELLFKVINPARHVYANLFTLFIDSWEKPLLADGFTVIDIKTQAEVPYQVNDVARGREILLFLSLAEKEEKIFAVKPGYSRQYFSTASDCLVGCCGLAPSGGRNLSTASDGLVGVDRVADIKNTRQTTGVLVDCRYDYHSLETKSLRVEWSLPEGITCLYDKTRQEQLLRPDRQHNAFTPVYEITPLSAGEDFCSVRRNMGRNRKGRKSRRFAGLLKDAAVRNQGKLFTELEFSYELAGTSFYSMLLRVYQDIPRMDVSVRMNKDSVWEPENLYIALPFGWDGGQLWLDKMGAVLRPGLDQLPGTNTDYYSLREGWGYLGNQEWLAVASPDAPLMQLGRLDYAFRELNENRPLDGQQVYSWPMNNYWETNFNASSGGFHQIKYSILSGSGSLTPEELIRKAQDLSRAAICFRIGGQEY